MRPENTVLRQVMLDALVKTQQYLKQAHSNYDKSQRIELFVEELQKAILPNSTDIPASTKTYFLDLKNWEDVGVLTCDNPENYDSLADLNAILSKVVAEAAEITDAQADPVAS